MIFPLHLLFDNYIVKVQKIQHENRSKKFLKFPRIYVRKILVFLTLLCYCKPYWQKSRYVILLNNDDNGDKHAFPFAS